MAFQFIKEALDERARPLFSKSKILGKSMLKNELGKLAQPKRKRKG